VNVPFDVYQAFGANRVPVTATIDGIPYRGSLVRMGGDCHVLGILKEIRTRIGKGAGDTVEVVVTRDAAPRVVDVPADLRAALTSSPPATTMFESLAFSHRREFVRWIEDAKRPDTRARRIAGTVDKVLRGEKPR